MFQRLLPPPMVLAATQREVDHVQQVFSRRRAALGARKRKKIERDIKLFVESWNRDTQAMRQKAEELNEFLEGKEEVPEFPFGPEASSNIDVRLAMGYARSARAQFNQMVFSDPARTYIMLQAPGIKRDDLNKVEASVNYTAENDTNLNETLKDTFIPAFRDGTSFVHGRWTRRVEHGYDFRRYSDQTSFIADYPDAETAGISPEEYDDILNFLQGAEAELHVEFELDFVKQNSAEYTVFPLAKFVCYPLYQQDINKMTLYGFTFIEPEGEFETKAKMGYYYEDSVEACRQNTPRQNVGGGIVTSSWDARRAALEGISESEPRTVSYNLAELVYTADIDDSGVLSRFLVIFDLEKHKALRIEQYSMPRNIPCIVPLRLVRRDGRFFGDSLLADAEHLFREINALHRHRSNQRRLTDSLTMLMPMGAKEYLDLGAEYGNIKPGTSVWLPDQYMHPNMAPRQLELQDTSRTNTSVDEESMCQRYLDMLLGASAGQSGRETMMDPRAPASKTAMLLRRADIRTEDLADEWGRTIPDLIDLHRALYLVNSTGTIKAITKNGDEVLEQEVPLEIFSDRRIRPALKGVKPSLAPEVEMQKIAAMAMGALQFGLPVQAKPQMLVEMWNEYVASSRVDRPERFQVTLGPSTAPAPMPGANSPENLMANVGRLVGGLKKAPASGPNKEGGEKPSNGQPVFGGAS